MSIPEGELGALKPGDEYWKGDVPMLVFVNRLQERATLEFSYANGSHLSTEISFVTALGLITDLNLKLERKG
jgi:hypothetical protein